MDPQTSADVNRFKKGYLAKGVILPWTLIGSGIFVILCMIPCMVPPLVKAYNSKETSCLNGEILNPGEQMWCSPSEKRSVEVVRQSGSVYIYWIKNKALPKATYKSAPAKQLYSDIPKNGHVSYDFEAMANSRIEGKISSDGNSIYIMSHDDYSNFVKGKKITYRESGKDELDLSKGLSLDDSDEYHIYLP